MSGPAEVFISYAHKDLKFLEELKKHLEPLRRQGFIRTWSDADITAGAEWKKAIDEHLDKAQVFLLLVSPDFMASDDCYNIEMAQAVERHNHGVARVIPIILRTTDNWTEAPFGKLQALPEGAKPIKRWHDRDEAFVRVTKGIREAIKQLNTQPPEDVDQTHKMEKEAWGLAPEDAPRLETHSSDRSEGDVADIHLHMKERDKKPQILIIEDDRNWQGLLQDILEDQMGYHADITGDLTTAKQFWDASTHYDLALVDVCLDQEEFNLSCQQIFAYLHTKHPEVPLVAITGKPIIGQRAFMLSRYGVVDFIEKGRTDLYDIQQRITSYLSKERHYGA